MPRKLGEVRTRDLIVLWGRAAGRCSHPECKRAVVAEAKEDAEAAAVGEAAHIVAPGPDGPRGGEKAPERIHGYENLILLCAHHHAIVDRQASAHPVEKLRAWKAEHEAWVAAATGPLSEPTPWTAIVQDPERRVDTGDAKAALGGSACVADWVETCGDPTGWGWEEAARREWRVVEFAVSRTPAERRRFAVFSLGRIPLAVQLGYVLGDRARAVLFHYDRDRGSWAWDAEAERLPGDGAEMRAVDGRGEAGARADEANLIISLSARVALKEVTPAGTEIEIAAAAPSVRWLRRAEQLTELARMYERALAAVRERGCQRVHLYYAGPAAGAVAFGRAYNPRMNPALAIYEYRRPEYERVLELNGNERG